MEVDPKEFLLFALQHFNLKVTAQQGKMVYLTGDYAVEVEGPGLYKLLQGGQVVAPFSGVEELCRFIKMDQQWNEEG